MAKNTSRSMTGDLLMGAGDGSYRDLAPDRGGDVETARLLHRQEELSPSMYGLRPAMPSGRVAPVEAMSPTEAYIN